MTLPPATFPDSPLLDDGEDRAARIIAFTNQAGGAGKSTSAVNIGAVAAEFGFKTLVVGLDAQCDASVALGYEPDDLPNQANLNDVLIGSAKIEDTIVPALAGPLGGTDTRSIENLYLALESAELEDAEQVLTTRMQRELWLKSALDPIRRHFDLILLDCPGNLGLVVINAIVAADEVVACVKPGWKELRALTRMETKIEQIESAFRANGAHAQLTHILVVDAPTTRNQGAVYAEGQDSVKNAYEGMVLPTVRRSPRIPQAYAAQKVLRFLDRSAEVTSDYYKVTRALGLNRRK